MHLLGLLLLTDVELLGGSLALGKGVTKNPVSTSCKLCQHRFGFAYPPAMPVGLEAPEPVAPSVRRRADAEK